jgi:DNA processing protein
LHKVKPFTTEKEACLALLIAAGGDLRQLKAAVRTHGSGMAALTSESLRARLKQGVSRPDIADQVAAQIQSAADLGAQWLTSADREFPAGLTNHPLLCVRGDIPPAPSVAIVGTRDADSYGLSVARVLASALAAARVCVVSGAAAGVDQAAHLATLESGGQTLAVLGTGIGGESSADKRALLERIANQGAVVSEFLFSARGARWTFPMRNQLIAELSDATVVVQAPRKSGALITARYAAEAGRPVYAVPGDVVHALSQGTNALIKAGEAALLAHPSDLAESLSLDDLSYAPWPTTARGVAAPEPHRGLGHGLSVSGEVIELLRTAGELRSDQIAERLPDLKTPIAEVLLDLELKGQVFRLAGDCYGLKAGGP